MAGLLPSYPGGGSMLSYRGKKVVKWLKTFDPEMSPAGTCPELIMQEGGEDLAGHSPSLVQREFRTSPCPPRGDWSHKQMKVHSGNSPVQTLRQRHSPRPRTLDASQERHVLQGPGSAQPLQGGRSLHPHPQDSQDLGGNQYFQCQKEAYLY